MRGINAFTLTDYERKKAKALLKTTFCIYITEDAHLQ